MLKMERMAIEYANKYGAGAAADILLLCGADGYGGTFEEYQLLYNTLRKLEKETAQREEETK